MKMEFFVSFKENIKSKSDKNKNYEFIIEFKQSKIMSKSSKNMFDNCSFVSTKSRL